MSIKLNSIKNIYFYLVSLIALMMIVYGTVDILKLGLTTFVFKGADQLDQHGMPPSYSLYPIMDKEGSSTVRCQEECDLTEEEKQLIKSQLEDYKRWQEQQKYLPNAQKQRRAVTDISILIVSIPLFTLHWLATRKLEKSEV